MSYQTIINKLDELGEWMFSDVTNFACVIGAVVVIGAINGVRISLNHCRGRYNGRIL